MLTQPCYGSGHVESMVAEELLWNSHRVIKDLS